MRFKKLLFAVMVFASGLGLAHCTSSTGNDEEVNQRARLTKMMDNQQYDDVIHLIESDQTASSDFPDLLAMAYLGKSGFEPLGFAVKVLAGGSNPDDPKSVALDSLLPGCDSNRYTQFDQIPIRCLLKRMWLELPEADDPVFAKARDLFRQTYPNVGSTPADSNTLIGVVEAASALSRLRAILLQYDSMDPAKVTADDVMALFTQVSLAADEAVRTLNRAEHSISPISKFLTGIESEPLFSGSGLSLSWLESTEMPLLIRFATDPSNTPESDTVKAALLQLLDQVVSELKNQNPSS